MNDTGRPAVRHRPTAGIDWASQSHAVSVVDADGREQQRLVVDHDASGLARLTGQLRRADVQEVAIERPDGPIVEALLEAGLTVFVIPPVQVKNLRGRYGSAGNKDDRFDAYVLADCVRTDRPRLRALTPDQPETVTLRMTCRARKDLVGTRVAIANQLRAHLQITFPAAVGLFADIDSPISLRFLTRFPDQNRADWLSPKRLAAWLTAIGYPGRRPAQQLHDRLAGAPRGANGPDGTQRAHITLALVATLTSIRTQIDTLEAQISEQLALHSDHPIFQSLPRSGTVRAARLLSEIGDCRARFPTPEALTSLAGVVPSTRQSGKHRTITYRWSCDKQLRDAVCDFAADSRRANPWAANLYQQAINRGHDHPHATRILARAWLHVIWKCWQTNTPYDPLRHRTLQALLQPTA